MDENEKKKTVKDLVKTFNSNPNKESNISNNAPKKEKAPFFPTLKKLPKDVKNDYTSDKKKVNNPEDLSKSKTQVQTKEKEKEKPKEKEDSDKNPFSFFLKKIKNINVKDDSNQESKPDNLKRRNSSYNKKKQIKEDEMFADNPDQGGGEIPDADDPVVPLTLKETVELLADPKFAKVKDLIL